MIVEVNQVTKTFGKQTVIDRLSMTIERPEVFGLLGPSGAGKTTLIKIIAGIESPTNGDVKVFGEPMPKLNVMQSFGYMAQADALYGELSAKENLEFFAGLYRLSGRQLKKRIDEVMETVGLQDDLNKKVEHFSGGMKRRLSLAIAMVHKPQLLILDEPTVGIDPILRQTIWEGFNDLKNSGTTILVTTHVMDEASKCDRLGMIRDGDLIACGTPEALKSEKNVSSIEDAFLAYGGATK